jgi:outer membrane protein
VRVQFANSHGAFPLRNYLKVQITCIIPLPNDDCDSRELYCFHVSTLAGFLPASGILFCYFFRQIAFMSWREMRGYVQAQALKKLKVSGRPHALSCNHWIYEHLGIPAESHFRTKPWGGPMIRIAFVETLLAISCLAPAVAGQAPEAAPQNVTLADAVRKALEKNPTVKAAVAYAQAVHEGIAEARAARYPRVDFSEGFTRGNNPVYVFGGLLTERQFTAGDSGLSFLNTPPPLDIFRTQFTAALPLYDAGQTGRRIKDAKLSAQGTGENSQRTRQEVIFNVVKAYTDELLARENALAAEAGVKSAQSDLHRAESRQEEGQAVPSDLLSAQVQLAQAQEDLLQAQNAADLAHAALNVAMGLSEDAATTIEPGLKESNFEPGALADRQQRALKSRPDLREAELGAERAANGSRMAHAEFLPKVNAFGSWEEDNETFLTRGGNNWTAGVSLNFNIFDGGANRARLAAAHYRQSQAKAQVEEMAAAVKLQVREAYLNLTTAQQRVEVSRQAQSEAEESLRIIQNRYEAGLATITDLLQVETAHTGAQKNYLNALFDYRLSYAALELATGELAADSPAVTQ